MRVTQGVFAIGLLRVVVPGFVVVVVCFVSVVCCGADVFRGGVLKACDRWFLVWMMKRRKRRRECKVKKEREVVVNIYYT